MRKSREYTRELTTKNEQTLKAKYSNHLKPVRKGFLNKKSKERLLQITRWEPHTEDRDVTDFFYEIRERAKSALLDLQLLCDTLNEEELHAIFTAREYGLVKGIAGDYPIVRVLNSLVPTSITLIKGHTPELAKEKEWRKTFLVDIAGMVLMWYYYSGIFQSNSHKNLIEDTLDAIEVMSIGTQNYSKMIEMVKKDSDD